MSINYNCYKANKHDGYVKVKDIQTETTKLFRKLLMIKKKYLNELLAFLSGLVLNLWRLASPGDKASIFVVFILR